MGEREESLEAAREKLAYELHWIQERIDPGPEGEWEKLSERDKNFYRECTDWILSKRGLVLAALGVSPTTTS